MRRSPIRLGRPALGWMASGRPPASGCICSSTSKSVLEPTEQLAPRAWIGSILRNRPTSAAERPVNVAPSSVNATCATIGRSVIERTAVTARAASSRSDIVSTTNASTPPSRRASACSRNAACASSVVTVPSGARYLPSGPIDPSTSTSRPELSRTSRASATPWRLISRTRPSMPCTASLNRFAPNVLVSMQSAPAAM